MAYTPTLEDIDEVYQPTLEDIDEIYEPTAEDLPEDESSPLELEMTRPMGKAETTGWKGLKEDALELLRNSLKSGLQFGRKLPSNIKEIAGQAFTNPRYLEHAQGQLLAGLADAAKGTLNLPHEIIGELGRKELIPDWLKKYNELPFTHIPEDTGVEKFMGLQPTMESDQLIRALPGIVGAGALAKKAVSPVTRKIKSTLSEPSKAKQVLRDLERQVIEAGDSVGLTEKQLEKLKEALRLQYSDMFKETLGEPTPVSLREKINVDTGKLEKLKPLTEIPEEDIGTIPEAPDTKSMIRKHKEAVEQAKEAALNEIGARENPRSLAGKKIKRAIEKLKSTSSNLYNSARKYYEDKNVHVATTDEIKAATKELEDLKSSDPDAPGYGIGTAEQQALEENLAALKSETAKAKDVFDLQRSLEKMADNYRDRQFESNSRLTDLERRRFGEIADKLDGHADSLAKMLESVGGNEVQQMIKEANKGWKIYKDMEKRNPIGRKALREESIPNDAIIKLAAEGNSNEFLNGLVKSDSELRKQLLASYVGNKNIERLATPDRIPKQYLESLPEVEEKVNAFKQALKDYKNNQITAEKVDKEHNALVKVMKEKAKEQAMRRDAVAESDKLKQQIQFKKDAIPQIEAALKEVESGSEEHKRLKRKLEEHKKFIVDKGGRLKELAKLIVKVKAIGKLPF